MSPEVRSFQSSIHDAEWRVAAVTRQQRSSDELRPMLVLEDGHGRSTMAAAEKPGHAFSHSLPSPVWGDWTDTKFGRAGRFSWLGTLGKRMATASPSGKAATLAWTVGVCVGVTCLYTLLAAPRIPSAAHATLYSLATKRPTSGGGENVGRALTSWSNPYGYINLIDPYAGNVFNPSLLVLPDTVYLGERILMVARGPEKHEVLQGEDVRWQAVLGLFVIPMRRKALNLPYLARESDLHTLSLPAKRKMPFQRCENSAFDQFIGAEDPRLFFTHDGQPLLFYSQTGRNPMICRAINVIDARQVVPGLTDAMSKAGWNPPVVFRLQTDLIRVSQSNIEKNWSPFQAFPVAGQPDDLWFHVTLVPQQIYKYTPNNALRPLDPTAPIRNCLSEIVNADSGRVKFHHATPLLKVTMCSRGHCKADIHNTVMFGIIHVKYHPEPYLFYERRVVTWNATSPFEYLSVSPPLTYVGTNQADPIFTVSMSWDHPTPRQGLGLNHGFLGERVYISFGVFDYGSAYIDVLVDELLTDHTLCRSLT